MSEITWAQLTATQRGILSRFIAGERIAMVEYELLASIDVLDMETSGNMIVTDLGESVLAQVSDPQPVAGDDAAMLAGNLDHVSTLWVQLHQELSTALGLEFEPNEDIERYSEAIATLKAQLAASERERQALRDAATRAYNCLDAVYETFDGDLGNGLSSSIPRVCDEIKAALASDTGADETAEA